MLWFIITVSNKSVLNIICNLPSGCWTSCHSDTCVSSTAVSTVKQRRVRSTRLTTPSTCWESLSRKDIVEPFSRLVSMDRGRDGRLRPDSKDSETEYWTVWSLVFFVLPPGAPVRVPSQNSKYNFLITKCFPWLKYKLQHKTCGL
jgi:hypothetical protein